jgi:hypothetical protein
VLNRFDMTKQALRLGTVCATAILRAAWPIALLVATLPFWLLLAGALT